MSANDDRPVYCLLIHLDTGTTLRAWGFLDDLRPAYDLWNGGAVVTKQAVSGFLNIASRASLHTAWDPEHVVSMEIFLES